MTEAENKTRNAKRETRNDAGQPDSVSRLAVRRSRLFFELVFILAIVVQIILSLPIALDFKLFAFYDPGATLKVDWLISPAGGNLVPTQDFAYSYGLLSLEIGRIWFAALGRTPWTFWLFSGLGMIAMVAGLLRLANAISFSRFQKYILLASLPLAVPAYYLSLTHVTEAALLIHALADQAKKKYARALLLVTIAAMVKPSMAYILGFILVVTIVIRTLKPRGFNPGVATARAKSFIKKLLPAATAALIICALLATRFGVDPLIKTLLPITGGASYKAAGFGFFTGAGRDFWILSSPLQYIFTPSGWWIVSTLVLWAAAVAVIVRRRATVAGGETIVTIAIMHAVFIFMFYAWRDSWTYYAYLPAFGLAAAQNVFPIRKWMMVLVFVLIACACGFRLSMTVGEWMQKSRHRETAGLWTYPRQYARWRFVSRLSQQQKTYWLVNGAVGQMFPGIVTPPSWWLSPKLQNEKEIAAIRKGIAESDAVIRWAEHGRLDPWLYPEFCDITPQFEMGHSDEWFIMEKRSP